MGLALKEVMCAKPQAFVLYEMPCTPKWRMTVVALVVAVIRVVSILSTLEVQG